MKKEIYLVVVNCIQYIVRNDNGKIVEDKTDAANLVDVYETYDAAVAHIDKLVEGQKALEPQTTYKYYGLNRENLFEQAKTIVYGWPHDQVLYGVESITPYNSKETFVMNRFIIKKEIK